MAPRSGRADRITCRAQTEIKMQGPSQGQRSQSLFPTCLPPPPTAGGGLQGITATTLGHPVPGSAVGEWEAPAELPANRAVVLPALGREGCPLAPPPC